MRLGDRMDNSALAQVAGPVLLELMRRKFARDGIEFSSPAALDDRGIADYACWLKGDLTIVLFVEYRGLTYDVSLDLAVPPAFRLDKVDLLRELERFC